MSARLSSLRTELDSVQSSESSVLLERDRALARITELEADVDRLNAEVERLAAETEGSNVEHEAALTDLAAMTAQRDALSHAAVERDRLQGELDTVITERNALSGQFHQVNGERDELSTRIDAVTAERDELSGQLQTVSAERDDAQQRLAVAETQNREHTTRLGNVDQLNTENADLTSRLAVAEQARVDLEGQLEEVSEKWKSTTRQLAVFENVNGQLDDAVAARKAAEDQLRLANASLASVRARIGLSHDTIRGELSSLESSLVTTPALDEPVDAPAELGDYTTEISTADEASTDSFMSDSLIADEPATDSLAGDSFIGDSFANEHGLIDDVSLPDDSHVDIASTDTPEMPNLELDGFNSDDGFNHDVADVGEIEVPSFEDSGLTFDGGMDEADGYDVAGIEMDPRTLGGKTIGDMFGEDQTHLDNTSLPGSDVFDPAPTNFATPDPIGFSSDMAPPAERRREVLDPGGLDDGAFARYVVTSPDVVLLIDGDGAAGLGWPHLDVATRRSALVEYLGSLTADSGAAADVVFVRAVGDEDALPVSRAVRVRIADHPVAESPIFASIIDGYPHEWPIAIVTNEPSLLVEADGLGVATLSNDQLLDLFLDLNPED